MERDSTRNGHSLTRREVLRATAVAGAAVAGGAVGLSGCAGRRAPAAAAALEGKRFAMVIDLQRCTGCGGCSLACKIENNTPDGVFWSDKVTRTYGTYPNVNYEYIPTLCNHCESAPCAQVCPTAAMHRAEAGIVNHDPDTCIGCKACAVACPYDAIFVNYERPHAFWRDQETALEGITASAHEVALRVKGREIPYYNTAREEDTPRTGIRSKGVPEKCNFCLHRLRRGLLPACVEACPCNARIFGDLNDPNSEVSRLLGKYKPSRRKEHLGTSPKVFYIRSYNRGAYKSTKGSV
jgi:molybdopterin-containing oxidoreductase family iron-sulfur binding subunit